MPASAGPAGPPDSVRQRLTEETLAPHAAAELVFVNGWFAPDLSSVGTLPAGVRIEPLSPALADDRWLGGEAEARADVDTHPFVALNTALFADGAIVRIPEGISVEGPVHLVFVSSGPSGGHATYPRVLVDAGRSSRVTVVERHVACDEGPALTCAVTELRVGEDADVDHYRVQQGQASSWHLGHVLAQAARGSRCSSMALSLGGAIVRVETGVTFTGEGAHAALNGLYLADGTSLVDHQTLIDHARPRCTSQELYKGLVGGTGLGIFAGRIIVRPDAQQTRARQTSKAMLLSEDARVHTKPQLEIFADDVACTHGATVGQLDDAALFYLRARGIGATEARRLLLTAFAGDVLDAIRLPVLREVVERAVERQLDDLLAPKG